MTFRKDTLIVLPSHDLGTWLDKHVGKGCENSLIEEISNSDISFGCNGDTLVKPDDMRGFVHEAVYYWHEAEGKTHAESRKLTAQVLEELQKEVPEGEEWYWSLGC